MQRTRRFLIGFCGLFLAASLDAQTLPVASGGASGFAAAVTIVGDDILVSRTAAEIRMATYPEAGALYVFRRDGAAWTVSQQISPAEGDVGDQFGASVAWAGETLLVGAPGSDETRGAAWVFTLGDDGWSEAARLPLEPDLRAGVGASAAITPDHFIVGAPGGLGDLARFGQPAPPQPGVVYVFDRARPTNAPERLGSSEPTGQDRFGSALLTIDDQLFVGAPGAAGGGAVFEFRREDGRWVSGRVLKVEGAGLGDRLGASLVSDGRRLFAGAPGSSGGGAVAVFDLQGGADAELIQPSGDARGGFGTSLALADDQLLVGAPLSAAGLGGTFAFSTTTLSQVQQLGADQLGLGSQFGSSAAAAGDVLVVGAGQADLRLGAAAVFTRSGDAWSLDATLHDPHRPQVAAVSGETVRCEDGAANGYECHDVDLMSFVPLSDLGAGPASIANDIWGWTDSRTGREYVLLGKSNGTSFVDITDPERPVYVGELPLTEGANENLWRDVKTYADHAFIVADGAGAHGVQVFDLRQLRDVRDPPVVFQETTVYDGVFSSHNIVINEETGFAHAVGSSGGGEACGGGLHMIDVRDPQSPTFAGCFANPETGGFLGGGYTHDAQCVTYRGPDPDFQGREICLHASINALGISDITDKDNPVAIAKADYPGVVAAHQGWLSEDHRYFFMGDELDEEGQTVSTTRTLVWDLEELDDPVLATEYFGPTAAIDHNQYVRGDFLYQSNLMSGLRIIDVSDPENPVEVAFFDTVPGSDATAFGGSWSNYPYFESGVIAVASWGEGLFLLKKREPALIP